MDNPPQSTLTIATPSVTTILPMTENMNDNAFMSPNVPYEKETTMSDLHGHEDQNNLNIETEQNNIGVNQDSLCRIYHEQQVINPDVTGSNTDAQTLESVNSTQQYSTAATDDSIKNGKKRNKAAKKNTKLDAKSKLEKSRQSARECRARKKLRYQYLEDLVCNREKAVIKLREELFMFCELSKQIDAGTLSEKDRLLLTDQSKENNRSESTSLL